jgi:CRISPR-associated protein Cmx8
VRAYVNQRVKARASITFEDFKASGYKDERYREAVNKVCMDAFLAIRARKDQRDFLTYFTGTICSVPQVLPEDEFQQLSSALLHPEAWEDVKSLAMLALSAHSQSPSTHAEKGSER